MIRPVQVGPYQITSRIAAGAQGAVFRARGPDGRDVAVKVLLGRSHGELARFQRERRLLSELASEGGVVPILDAGLVKEGPYVVMPYLAGGTLREKLRSPIEPDEVESLARELCEVVGRCHARGVVHRDLKPENVLFDAEGRAFVADLGLAKHFDLEAAGASQSQSLSKTGELRGTPGYSAPEQFRDAKAAGPEADVFSLGAILYECLTGKPAFPGETTLEVIARIEEGIPPERLDVSGTRPALCRAIERALSFDPAKRPRDATELLFDIDSEEAPGRKPVVAVAAAAALLVALLAVLFIFWSHGPARPTKGSGTGGGTATGVGTGGVTPRPTPARTLDPAALTRDPAVESGLVRGRSLFAHGALAQALDEAETVVDRAPGDARGYDLRGHVRLALLEYSTAAKDFTRALAIDDKLADAWSGRAWALGARVATISSESLTCAERALALAPDAPETWIARSFARTVGDPPGAVVDARHAVALDANDAQTHCALANALGNSGDWRSALPEIEAALAIAPEDPHALVLRGVSVTWLEDRTPQAAEADADRVLARAPRSHLALRLRGRYRGLLGNHKGAIADLRQAVSVEPDDHRGWRDLGIALEQSSPAEAEVVLTKAIALAPDDSASWFYRGRVRLSQGALEGASKDLARACELDPSDGNGWQARGQVAFARKQWPEAAASFERSVGLKPDQPGPWIDLARARLALQQLEPARLALNRAFEVSPDNPHALAGRAFLHHADGDDTGAMIDLEKAIAGLPPEDPDSVAAHALLRQLKKTAPPK